MRKERSFNLRVRRLICVCLHREDGRRAGPKVIDCCVFRTTSCSSSVTDGGQDSPNFLTARFLRADRAVLRNLLVSQDDLTVQLWAGRVYSSSILEERRSAIRLIEFVEIR